MADQSEAAFRNLDLVFNAAIYLCSVWPLISLFFKFHGGVIIFLDIFLQIYYVQILNPEDK